MQKLLAIFAAALFGCSSGETCNAVFTGNFSESDSSPGCASLSASQGDWTLLLGLNAAGEKAAIKVKIDLGPSPTPGTYGSDTVSSWDALGASSATQCVFAAGSDAVPNGSFSLTIDSISGLGSSKPAAHGSLSLTQYVQAPVGVDCGAGDNELVEVSF